MKLTLEGDEIQMLVEILKSEKRRLEEVLRFSNHYKRDLSRAKWDLEHLNGLLKQLEGES